MHTSREGEPVVGMNNVELLRACQHASDDREIVNLIMQIARIAPSEAHTTEVVKSLHVIEISIDVIAETIVVFSGMTHEAVFDVVILHIAPGDRHLTHVNDFEKFLLVACWLRHTECGLHIALYRQTLGDAVGCYGKSAIYFRRELPSEH